MTPRQAFLLVTAAFLWGSAYPFVSLALRGFPPAAVVFLRCAMGAVALLAVILAEGGEARAALSDLRRRPGPALLLAVTFQTAPFLLIAFAQQRVPGGLTGVLVATTPIFVALFALRLDPSERFGRRRAAGLLVGLLGVGLVVGVETLGTAGQFLSALLVLVAAAFFASAGFVTKRYYGGIPAITRAFFAVSITSALTLVPAAASLPDGLPGAGAVVGLLLLGFGSTGFGLLAYFTLIDRVGAGRAALTTYLGPGFSLGMAALLLGEPITASAVAGLALILCGVFVASRAERPPGPPPAIPGCEGLGAAASPTPPAAGSGPRSGPRGG